VSDPHTEEFHAAWVEALDRLEVDVTAAEAMLAAATEEPVALAPWVPPPVRGPLPSDLEPRARLVLERQLAVAQRLTQRVTRTGRHRQLTERIRGTAHADIPVYVDLRA